MPCVSMEKTTHDVVAKGQRGGMWGKRELQKITRIYIDIE